MGGREWLLRPAAWSGAFNGTTFEDCVTACVSHIYARITASSRSKGRDAGGSSTETRVTEPVYRRPPKSRRKRPRATDGPLARARLSVVFAPVHDVGRSAGLQLYADDPAVAAVFVRIVRRARQRTSPRGKFAGTAANVDPQVEESTGRDDRIGRNWIPPTAG